MKIVSDLLDAKTARTAAIVMFVATALISALLIAGKSSYTPGIADNLFGVHKQVDDEMDKVRTKWVHLVDSGYTKTFIFVPVTPTTPEQAPQAPQVMYFYSAPDQDVELRGTADSTSSARILILADNYRLIDPTQDQRQTIMPPPGENKDIDIQLNPPLVGEPSLAQHGVLSGDIHTLEIRLLPGEVIAAPLRLNMIIIVRNQ
ncbi:MAG TPA: hypothetical protein VN934_05820 [Candidatus Tumulicola sp.]|nr:hypothetical protein [Candidatus Tumulicola sp.]